MRVRLALGSHPLFQDDREWESPKHGCLACFEQLPSAGWMARVERLLIVAQDKDHGVTSSPLVRVM
jgi:hypothetical protein